jgi:Domain of unknown function (DUF5011)
MKIIKFTLLISFVLLLGACKPSNQDKKDEPEIPNATFSLLRDKELMVGETFEPLDLVKATDHDGTDLTSKITFTGTVDEMKPGNYVLTYQVIGENGQVVTALRTITVISNPPRFIDTKREIQIELGDHINLLICLIATDDVDGDLSNQIEVIDLGGFDQTKPGSYTVTYQVKDSQGQENTHKRKLVVREAMIYSEVE